MRFLAGVFRGPIAAQAGLFVSTIPGLWYRRPQTRPVTAQTANWFALLQPKVWMAA